MIQKIWFRFLDFIASHVIDYWWVAWSNYRWRKVERQNIGISNDERIQNIADVRRRACSVNNVFKWTSDGLNQLGDSIVPPSTLYIDFKKGKVRDDCDGFHCLMYHFLVNSGHKAVLLTVNAKRSGHCVLLCQLDQEWYVLDYMCLYGGFSTKEAAIQNYNKEFVVMYEAPSEVFHNGVFIYDYQQGKFKVYKG